VAAGLVVPESSTAFREAVASAAQNEAPTPTAASGVPNRRVRLTQVIEWAAERVSEQVAATRADAGELARLFQRAWRAGEPGTPTWTAAMVGPARRSSESHEESDAAEPAKESVPVQLASDPAQVWLRPGTRPGAASLVVLRGHNTPEAGLDLRIYRLRPDGSADTELAASAHLAVDEKGVEIPVPEEGLMGRIEVDVLEQ